MLTIFLLILPELSRDFHRILHWLIVIFKLLNRKYSSYWTWVIFFNQNIIQTSNILLQQLMQRKPTIN